MSTSNQAHLPVFPSSLPIDSESEVSELSVIAPDFLENLPAISIPLTGDSFQSFWNCLSAEA